MWLEVFLFITIFAAAFVQSTTGFAFSILIMALWPVFLPVPEATQLLMFGSVALTAYIVVRYWRHIDFKTIAVPLVPGLIGTYIGANALLALDNAVITKVLGGLLILLAIYFLAFSRRICIPENPLSASIAGIVSGLMGGFFNISGPPIVLYCSVTSRCKEEYLATVQFYFLVMIVFKMAYLWIRRGLSDMVITHIPLAVAGSMGGMLLGLWCFRRMSGESVKKMVYVIMILSGIWYIVK